VEPVEQPGAFGGEVVAALGQQPQDDGLWGGGQHAARRLRRANLLACGIGARSTPM
jgi:hypothetical protein